MDNKTNKMTYRWIIILSPWLKNILNFYEIEPWSISFQLYFKNYDICKYVKFEAILWKIDILSISADSNFKLKKNVFAPMLHRWM